VKPPEAKWTRYAMTLIMDKLRQTEQQSDSDRGPPSILQFYSSVLRTTINTMDGTTKILTTTILNPWFNPLPNGQAMICNEKTLSRHSERHRQQQHNM
jgi:hypothetical protein